MKKIYSKIIIDNDFLSISVSLDTIDLIQLDSIKFTMFFVYIDQNNCSNFYLNKSMKKIKKIFTKSLFQSYIRHIENISQTIKYIIRDHIILNNDKGAIRWWDAVPYEGEKKWDKFDHNGVLFAQNYVSHNIKMKYNGFKINLCPESEECATWFASLIDTDYVKNPIFQKNFFHDFKNILKNSKTIPHPEIINLEDCDFVSIFNYFKIQKNEKKCLLKNKEWKIKQNIEKECFDRVYGFCLVDGFLERVGNYKIEPPGLFKGRGDHPKIGKIKKRLLPEDIIINIGKKNKIPKCPCLKYNWGNITYDDNVTYLAKWIENITGSYKFVYLHSSSRFKGLADRDKYEKARRLKDIIINIRSDYTEKFTSNSIKKRQLSTAIWMIDILAIRVGNEKDPTVEADTVGVCSLRIEHMKLIKKSEEVIFDFLGKDSMRYYKKIKFPTVVFKNMSMFMEKKKKNVLLFNEITPFEINEYLSNFMNGLTAKVFRTFNASITLQNQLKKTFKKSRVKKITPNSFLEDKLFFYNQ